MELLLCLVRVMADDVPDQKPDAAYLVGETIDNASSVLLRGAQLWKQGLVPKIAIQKGGEGFGYCGYEYSRRQLLLGGVPANHIIPMPILSEFEEGKIVHMAMDLKWRRVYIVAPPFHQLRSFITAVTAADHAYPELKIYNYVGVPLSWKKPAIHSQGTFSGNRIELFLGEIQRIQTYQEASVKAPLTPLVSIERALAYLDQRDV